MSQLLNVLLENAICAEAFYTGNIML